MKVRRWPSYCPTVYKIIKAVHMSLIRECKALRWAAGTCCQDLFNKFYKVFSMLFKQHIAKSSEGLTVQYSSYYI
jgi:hemerythrin